MANQGPATADPAEEVATMRMPGTIMTTIALASLRTCRATLPALIGVMLLLTAAGRAWGGADRWTVQGGPGGGSVSALAVDPAEPRTLFAGATVGGLFRSGDSGDHWVAVGGGPTRGDQPVLAIDPGDPRTIFAGHFRSSDGGATWVPQTAGPFASGGTLVCLVFAPSQPSVVYALAAIFGLPDSFFRSADGGATWEPLATPFIAGDAGTVSVDPQAADTLFVPSLFGLFRSVDGGRTWADKSPVPDRFTQAARVVFDPHRPRTVFAMDAASGLYRSVDGGDSWRAVGAGAGGLVLGASFFLQDLAFSGDGSTLVVGARYLPPSWHPLSSFFQSDDSGATWTPLSRQVPFALNALAADPSTAGRLYATAAEGVFRSDDGGRTWAAKVGGLVMSAVTGLAADSQLPSTLYAVDADGVLSRSPDGGSSWLYLRGGVQPLLAVDPTHAGTFFAASALSLLRLTAEGNRSRPLQLLLHCTVLQGLIVDPAAPSTLYVTLLADNGIGCHDDSGVLDIKSADGGRTFVLLPNAVAPPVIGPPGSTLYARDIASGRLVRSVDGGATWVSAGTGLPADFVPASLVVSPIAPWLYVSGQDGTIYRSENGAHGWTQVAPSPLGAAAALVLVVDPRRAAIVYGYGGGRFFRSLDAGATWREHGAGLAGLGFSGPLVVDVAHPARVLAGTADGSILAIDLPRGR
jgi:photosystem II stability/assembly factor-like uncharacterized protein